MAADVQCLLGVLVSADYSGGYTPMDYWKRIAQDLADQRNGRVNCPCRTKIQRRLVACLGELGPIVLCGFDQT